MERTYRIENVLQSDYERTLNEMHLQGYVFDHIVRVILLKPEQEHSIYSEDRIVVAFKKKEK